MIVRAVSAFLLAACVLASAPGRSADDLSDDSRRYEPVGVGELAPDFTLTDHRGQRHTLSAERGRRVVVLVFYRGHW